MGEVIRLTLEGDQARPGRIPAADVVRLLRGYERAIARAAEARVSREARTGRRGGAIERTTRLIFRAATDGSLVLELELPELEWTDETLDLSALHLGHDSARDVQRLLADPESQQIDRRVVDAVAALAEEMDIGERYPSLTVEWTSVVKGYDRPPLARVRRSERDTLVRRRRQAVEQETRPGRLTGILVEGDFENRGARLRTTDNRLIDVVFDDNQADLIYDWLRRQSAVIGEVSYTPEGRVLDVRLIDIEPPEQLALFKRSSTFYEHRPVERLAQEQHVGPIEDIVNLPRTEATADEIDAFLLALSS